MTSLDEQVKDSRKTCYELSMVLHKMLLEEQKLQYILKLCLGESIITFLISSTCPLCTPVYSLWRTSLENEFEPCPWLPFSASQQTVTMTWTARAKECGRPDCTTSHAANDQVSRLAWVLNTCRLGSIKFSGALRSKRCDTCAEATLARRPACWSNSRPLALWGVESSKELVQHSFTLHFHPSVMEASKSYIWCLMFPTISMNYRRPRLRNSGNFLDSSKYNHIVMR